MPLLLSVDLLALTTTLLRRLLFSNITDVGQAQIMLIKVLLMLLRESERFKGARPNLKLAQKQFNLSSCNLI